MTIQQPSFPKTEVRQSIGEFLKVIIFKERGLTQEWDVHNARLKAA